MGLFTEHAKEFASYAELLSAIEQDKTDWDTPEYKITKSKYILQTHIYDHLDSVCVEDTFGGGSTRDKLFAAVCHGGSLAVYKECLRRGCTISQLLNLRVPDGDTEHYRGSMDITLEECYGTGAKLEVELTLLNKKIALYESIDANGNFNPEVHKDFKKFVLDNYTMKRD